MKLVIITGLPATGKTTLGKRISKNFSLPFFSKDKIKEIMYDFIGSKKDVGKEKISKSSYEILYHILEQNLITNNSIILESNFIPEFSNKVFKNFKEKYNFDIFQIKCNTEGNILFERFKERSFGNDRHEGHDDKNNIEAWKDILLKGEIDSLDIGGELLNLDTTNFEDINYKKIYLDIKLFLER